MVVIGVRRFGVVAGDDESDQILAMRARREEKATLNLRPSNALGRTPELEMKSRK